VILGEWVIEGSVVGEGVAVSVGEVVVVAVGAGEAVDVGGS